jgi:hypothetical protein
MTSPTIAKQQNSVQTRATYFPILIFAMLLASCGGGGAESAPPTDWSDVTKQALGASGMTSTVPTGWVGRAPKMEIINGISVPPEPTPAINNATLAGVDINANGVRDDVERKLALQSTNFSGSMRIANAYQAIVTNSLPLTRSQALTQHSILLCAMLAVPTTAFGATTNSLRDITFNNSARVNVLKSVNKALDGGYEGSELLPCQ